MTAVVPATAPVMETTDLTVPAVPVITGIVAVSGVALTAAPATVVLVATVPETA
jgi:hypothetical protein